MGFVSGEAPYFIMKKVQTEKMHGIDLKFMEAAMEEARKGMTEGGIPIGAVLVKEGVIIGKGHNMRIQTGNRMSHAEIDCLEDDDLLHVS